MSKSYSKSQKKRLGVGWREILNQQEIDKLNYLEKEKFEKQKEENNK